MTTGWSIAAVSSDGLTAGGESQSKSALSQQSMTQPNSIDPLIDNSPNTHILALSSTLGYSNPISVASTVSSLDALLPNSLIGSELLQSAV
jgi:hypothetical protein